MDYSALNDMVKWEREKALFLIETAENLGMELDSFGEIGVNQHSGYTYIWSENYPFTLFMPINCELTRDDVFVLFTNFDNGDEEEIILGDMSLDDIYESYEAQLKEWKEEE